MFKKSMATAMLVLTIPALASASWFLTTEVKNTGGSLDSINKTGQVVTDQAITRSYNTIIKQTPVANPGAGNSVRYLKLTDSFDGSTTTTDVPATGFTPVDGHMYSLAATFQVSGLSVSAGFATGSAGSVTPSTLGNIYYGYKLQNNLVFTFAPVAGGVITDIGGVPDGATLALPAAGSAGVNKRATVTFPAGYTFKAPVALAATVSMAPTPSLFAGLPQTVTAGTGVVLQASSNQITSPSYKWTYVSGPANTTTYSTVAGKVYTTVTPGPAVALTPDASVAGKISFTAPTAPGQYKFTLEAGGLTTLATVNVVTQAADMAAQCQFCHTANNIGSPTIASGWSKSVHADKQCGFCHVGTQSGSHPGAMPKCSDCHDSASTGFAQSLHWNTTANAGWHRPPEPTDPGLSCIYRCHFKATDYVAGSATTSTGAPDNSVGTGYGCTTCHGGTLTSGGSVTVATEGHKILSATVANTCYYCHSGSRHGVLPNEFFNSKHWKNDFEYGPEFANQMNTTVTGGTVTSNGTVDGVLNPNDGYTTTEDGTTVTCAYRCHFRPGMGPQKDVAGYLANGKATTYVAYTDTLNGVTYNRPGGDSCLACHDSHNLKASYQTCLSCHTGGKHGKVPNEFWGSKHWQNSFEYGDEFKDQYQSTVKNGDVKLDGKVDGVLNPNDGYTTTEDGATVTCAYRCHFRPGMGPQKDVTGYLANGKSTSYVMYSSPYGAGRFYRPGGDACMACHDPHGLEANARSTCYTCHAGGNHGWSVKAFEKSTHFTGTYATTEGIGGPTGKACTACHNAHSTEAQFFAYSSATTYNAAVKGALGCQSCHTPGAPYGIYDANRIGKAPHFQTSALDAYGYYPTASYVTDNPAYSNACADCHSHNNTINKGWAEGGHGKIDAIPWVTSKDDDWNRGTNVNGHSVNYQLSAQKSDCQRCHTAKGFAQFWDSGFTNISTLGGKSSAPLVCSGCHSNVDKGTIRPLPAAFATGVKTYVGYSTVAYSTKKSVTAMTFPDMKNSNICIPCHAGRGTGALIKEVYKTPSATPWMIGTRIYSHFAAAAGVVNGSNAYEFTAPKANTHSLIGTNVLYGTGKNTQGPCVGCHMTANGTAKVPNMSHSVEAIDLSAGTFKTDVCKNCHGSEFTVADVANSKAQFNAALNVLRNLLLQRGIDALQAEINSRPGERMGQDMRGNAASQAMIASLGLDQVLVAERNTGAAFNWWLFGTSNVAQGDAAGYVHNPGYARQVIMDSIDWLDDYQLNGSAQNTIKDMVGKTQPTYGGVADGVIIDQTTADLAAAFATPATNNHFAPAAATYKTQYVAGSSVCTTCHNPQESDLQKAAREAWAESAHGETTGLAWNPSSSHLWTASGSTANFSTAIPASDCLRCHTADGFAQFATGTTPFTNVKNLAGDGKTNSPLNCQACHTNPLDDTSTRRVVTAVSTFYNVSTVDKNTKATVKSHIATSFPDVGESNMCISCHSGRVAGRNLTDLAASGNWSVSNSSFQNSHYMAAAGVMYMKSGFINFTTLTAPTPSSKDGQPLKLSTKSYAATLLPDSASTPGGISGGTTSTHRLIGTLGLAPAEGAADGETPYLGRGTDPAQRPLAQGGPCVNCHLQAFNPDKGDAAAADNPLALDLYAGDVPAKRAGAGHALTSLDQESIKQICLPCHAHTKGLNLENFMQYKVNPAKTPYQDTLDLIKMVLLNNYKISYDSSSYPYFYDEALPLKDGKKQAVTDWTRAGQLDATQAYRLHGACFNLNLLARDKGGYIHGRTYVQRLQYDTIDYLDDLQMNFSALNTARSVYPAKFFGNNANTGYLGSDSPVASEGVLWLSGTHPNNNELDPPDGTSVLPIKLRP